MQGAEITVPFDAYGQSISLDPHRSADYGGFWVMYPNVWDGFLRYDENGRIALDLAEKVVRSQDGLRYTCTIREGATYASGNPVLAEHFIRPGPARSIPPISRRWSPSWNRCAASMPGCAADQGAELGFTAQDDRTVVVELEQPVTYFPSFLASFVWSVVDPAILEISGRQTSSSTVPVRDRGSSRSTSGTRSSSWSRTRTTTTSSRRRLQDRLASLQRS